jgi:hypothetical protein
METLIAEALDQIKPTEPFRLAKQAARSKRSGLLIEFSRHSWHSSEQTRPTWPLLVLSTRFECNVAPHLF